jgi:RNA polymerase primary sigma factor
MFSSDTGVYSGFLIRRLCLASLTLKETHALNPTPYNAVNDLILHDIHSPEDLDDVLATISRHGIDVLEGQRKLLSSALDKQFKNEGEVGEDIELDQTPGPLETIKDPARIYLREMGVVPLLTREGEVDIAKRIERGQRRVLRHFHARLL